MSELDTPTLVGCVLDTLFWNKIQTCLNDTNFCFEQKEGKKKGKEMIKQEVKMEYHLHRKRKIKDLQNIDLNKKV